MLWHIGCSDLRELKKQESQEDHCDLHSVSERQRVKLPGERRPSYSKRKVAFLSPGIEG